MVLYMKSNDGVLLPHRLLGFKAGSYHKEVRTLQT
jgi:hypothetical protein